MHLDKEVLKWKCVHQQTVFRGLKSLSNRWGVMMAERQPEWGHLMVSNPDCHWDVPSLKISACARLLLCDREGRNRALEMEREIITPLIPSNTHWHTIFVYCILEKMLYIKKQLGPEATATSNVHPVLKWRGKSASALDECRNSVTEHCCYKSHLWSLR